MIPQLPFIAESIIKIMVLIGLGMYALFAAVMVRQEQLMDKVIDETFEPVLRVLVFLHLLGSLILLGVAFFVL